MRCVIRLAMLVVAIGTPWGSPGEAQSLAQVSSELDNATTPLSREISLDLKNVPVAEALAAIGKSSGVVLGYSSALLPNDVRVTIRTPRITVYEALKQTLSRTSLVFKQGANGKISIIRNREVAFVQGVVAGKVFDAKTGAALAQASISIGRSLRTVVTGEDGSYRIIAVAPGPYILTVRLVGYAKQTRSIVVGEGATVAADFKLEPTASLLNQVIVTGTIVSTELKAVPNAITVVTAKQIEERGITRIDQLFRGDIPGLFSLGMGSRSALDEVTMFSRGATALPPISVGTGSAGVDATTGGITNPIKTYIDGVEMSDSKYLSQIDPRSIERIEILTGPQASTIYGSNAINGVMQIFTKRGAGSKPRLTASLISGVAQNNFSSHLAPSHLVDASISGIEGIISYNVGSSWDYAGAWTPSKQTQRLSINGGGRVDLGEFSADVSARRGLTQTRQRGQSGQGQVELSTTGIWVPNPDAGIVIPQTWNLLGQTVGLSVDFRPYSWWSHEVGIGTDGSTADIVQTSPAFNSSLPGVDTSLVITTSTAQRRSERYTTTVALPIFSVTKFNLTLGGDHWRTTGSSWSSFSTMSLTGAIANPSVIRNRPGKNSGAYVQGQLGIMDELFLTYGVRADWNPNFGDDVKVKPGRYGMSYTRDVGPLSVKLRGSYGRSIRPPSEGYELAVPVRPTSSGFRRVLQQFGQLDRILANPDLGPEHQSGGEGGVEVYFGSRGSLVVTRYNQTVDNLITLVDRVDSVRSLTNTATVCSSTFRDADGYCYRYQLQFLNVGSIRNQGWELASSLNMGPLTTRGTYSWTKSRIIGITPRYRALLQSNSPSFQPGRPFNYLPEHTWALGVTYAQAQSTVSLFVNGVGMRYVNNDALSLAASNFSTRFTTHQPRWEVPSGYRSLGKGYAIADLNATHRFGSRIEGVFQVANLANYYQNDFSAEFAAIGRQTRAGIRIR